MHTRGIDHLAIVADDMPTAMDFYTRVMGFRLVHVRRVPYERDRGQPPYENLRHYFFDMGNDSLFAVFEYPKGLPRQNRDHLGGMQSFVKAGQTVLLKPNQTVYYSAEEGCTTDPLVVGALILSIGYALRARRRRMQKIERKLDMIVEGVADGERLITDAA